MDPGLVEAVEGPGGEHDEIAALVRLTSGATTPDVLRLVAGFGDVWTCRLRRGDAHRVWSDPRVPSLKTPRRLYSSIDTVGTLPSAADAGEPRARTGAVTGRGSVVGIVDYGLDFTRQNLLTDGGTKLLALWDQRTGEDGGVVPYGYGTVHTREAIDRALRESDPFAALGYDLEAGRGRHGTIVADIAAGTSYEGPGGVAPGADLVFVDFSTPDNAPRRIGNSVSLLEAVHWIVGVAAGRPCSVNLSLGAHSGPHDGSTLTEQALDWLVRSRPGLTVQCSAGNYYRRPIHAAGHLRAGGEAALDWIVDPADETANELEVWYPGSDRLEVRLVAPDGRTAVVAPAAARGPIVVDGRPVGRFVHRCGEPNNGDCEAYFAVDPGMGGRWRVLLRGLDVQRGDYHVWIERDDARPGSQSRLPAAQAVRSTTTGTICNGRTITVGAYDARTGAVAPFSSAGPTRDGRVKPDIAGPGVDVVAARSGSTGDAARLTVADGTSMATPHVTGCAALLHEAAGRPLTAAEVMEILFATAVRTPGDDPNRLGHGRLAVEAAVQRARAIGTAPPDERPRGSRQSTEAGAPPLTAPARAFDALTIPARTRDRARLQARAEVVGWPGRELDGPVLPDDLVVRRALGEGALAGVGVVERAIGETVALRDVAIRADARPVGRWAFAEWQLTEDGRLRPDTAVLRLRDPAVPSDAAWRGDGAAESTPSDVSDLPELSASTAEGRAAEDALRAHLGLAAQDTVPWSFALKAIADHLGGVAKERLLDYHRTFGGEERRLAAQALRTAEREHRYFVRALELARKREQTDFGLRLRLAEWVRATIEQEMRRDLAGNWTRRLHAVTVTGTPEERRVTVEAEVTLVDNSKVPDVGADQEADRAAALGVLAPWEYTNVLRDDVVYIDWERSEIRDHPRDSSGGFWDTVAKIGMFLVEEAVTTVLLGGVLKGVQLVARGVMRVRRVARGASAARAALAAAERRIASGAERALARLRARSAGRPSARPAVRRSPAAERPPVAGPGAAERPPTATGGERPPAARAAPAAVATVSDTVAARLRARGHTDVLDWFDDVPAGAARDDYARKLVAMSDRELDGLEVIARLPEQQVSFVGAIDDLFAWDPQLRQDLLGAVAEVAPHADDTLGGVLHGILQRTRTGQRVMLKGFQGSFGQLLAARHAVRDLGATTVRFEVRLPGRQVDIEAIIGGRPVHIEVKTPVAGPAGFEPKELMYDLVHYAGDSYQGLRYLYPEGTKIAGLPARMKHYFSRPEVQQGLAAKGIAREAAERSFAAWVTNGVAHYRL